MLRWCSTSRGSRRLPSSWYVPDTPPLRPGRSRRFAATDQFVTGTQVEQYQAIGLELPDERGDVGSRRVIAARFATREDADAAAAGLEAQVGSGHETPISVAALGAPGMATDIRSYLVVVRVTMSDYPRAERVIADNAGEVIHTAREPAPEPATAPVDEAETEPGPETGGWSEVIAPA